MNKLSTAIAAIASFAVVTVFSTSACAGDTLDHVLKTKTLKAAVATDWAPASFVNDKGQLDGYDVDVTKEIAKRLGVEAQFVTPGWDLIAAGKWEGRWDVGMGQMTPTKARAEKFDLSNIYFYEQAVAIVHKDSKATKLSDLDGKRVGGAADTSALAYAAHTFTPGWIGAKPMEFKFKPSEIKAYQSSGIALDDLRLGDGVRLDAIVTDGSFADNAIKSGYPIKVLGTLFSSPGVVAILKGDKEFSEKIAAAVKSMRDDGTLSKLSIKWYGSDFTVEKQ
ncbi:transporter substrate-binding domain-containing protein [Rhizobium etli]|uniref:transporter substrate-binding domain-containing protein n=1 Tax=Rhizobium etli TaxID=29449 RepID=UPI0003839C6F|nr:transporter substrate-binding domain-containing protein [Rhizobium etli]AGS24462.1 ABC transporter substrate-binding protein [Rhizobium etli bv. mimosae str. Mim1]